MAAISPQLDIAKSAALPARQAQVAHLTAHRCCGAMDPVIVPQPHQVAPAGLVVEPAEQLAAREAAVGQQGDGANQELIGFLQQSDRDLSAEAGAGISSVRHSSGVALLLQGFSDLCPAARWAPTQPWLFYRGRAVIAPGPGTWLSFFLDGGFCSASCQESRPAVF